MNIWHSIVRGVEDGEPVDEISANRAITALVDRTDWLKQQLSLLDHSSGRLVTSSALTSSDVNDGDWVYYDEDLHEYRNAIAELEWDSNLNSYSPTKRAFVVGVVLSKITSTTANILLYGTGVNLIAETSISSMNELLQSNEGAFSSGRYFLSSINPGKMTKTPLGSPIIPLGYFTDTVSTISPSLKDVFESHVHHRFSLRAIPGSTQGLEGGWTHRDSGEDEDTAFVDYGAQQGHLIQPCIRRDPSKAPSSDVFRVDITRDEYDNFVVTVRSEVDADDPSSEGTLLDTIVDTWPFYGEEIQVPGTDLLVSFIRVDYETGDRHANIEDLSSDIESGNFVGVNEGWKILIPNDYIGWTNANPIDTNTPAGSYFRYQIESHGDLYAMFPPIPVEGVGVFVDGVEQTSDQYQVTHRGIWCKTNKYTGDEESTVPWAWTYDNGILNNDIKHVEISFTKSSFHNSESVVKGLHSDSPIIKINGIGGSEPKTTGVLTLDFKLDSIIPKNQNTKETAGESDVAISGVGIDQVFTITKNVACLIPGDNISLSSIKADGTEVKEPPFTGRVKVSAEIPDYSSRLEALETAMAIKFSFDTGNAYSDTWTLSKFLEVFPILGKSPAFEASFTGFGDFDLSQLPPFVPPLHPAIHSSAESALSLPAYNRVASAPLASQKGLLFQNKTGSLITIPLASYLYSENDQFGHSYPVPAGGYASFDGVTWYPLVNYGEAQTFYSKMMERTIWIDTISDQQLIPGRSFEIFFTVDAMAIKANTAWNWSIVIETANITQEVGQGVGSNLQSLNWSEARYEQQIVLGTAAKRYKFGYRVTRDSISGEMNSKFLNFGVWNNALSPEEAKFAFRVRLIKSDTVDQVTNPVGFLAVQAFGECKVYDN